MAETKKGSYPGHDEGTKLPSNTHGINYNSPATHADLSDSPISVNVKTPSGHKGGDSK